MKFYCRLIWSNILYLSIYISYHHWYLFHSLLLKILTNSIAAASKQPWKFCCKMKLSKTCWHVPFRVYIIIDISSTHICWDIWQTALHQHCSSSSSGTSLKLKHDALFVFNMYINHWYLYLSYLLWYLTNSIAKAAPAQIRVGSSNMMSYVFIICILIIGISIPRVCWNIWCQHCTSTAPASAQTRVRS